MRRRLAYILPILAVLAIAVFLLVRGTPSSRPAAAAPNPGTPAFPRPGVILLTFERDGREARLFDASSTLLAVAPIRDRQAEFLLNWQPGQAFQVGVDGLPPDAFAAPAVVPELRVILHAPLGQEPVPIDLAAMTPGSLRRVMVPGRPGETLDLMLEVEKLRDTPPVDVEVDSALPLDGPARAALAIEFDKQLWQGRLTVGSTPPAAPWTVAVRAGEAAVTFELELVSTDFDPSHLAVQSWHLPATRTGQPDPRYLGDQIALPNQTWVRLALLVGIRPETVNYYEPYVYQSVALRYGGPLPLSVMIVSEVLDPGTGEPVPFFQSPQIESSFGSKQVVGYARLTPGTTTPCLLPVYVQPETPVGSYRRRVTVQPMGSDRVLAVHEAPLGIVRANSFYTAWVLGIGLLSLGWLAAIGLGYRRLVRSLGVRRLVLLSLLGSLQFGIGFAGAIVANLFYVVLGPFNCLVGGLLSEVTIYLLVTSILCLVPRVGAMTLAGLVTYLMGGIMFGSFGLHDVLFIGSAIAFREFFLFAFGVTSFGDAGPSPPRLLPMMLALGLADAATTFTSLVLQSVFYRLYFAPWYVLLQVIVTGFLYTLIGVWLGRTLGLSLRKVHP